MEGRAWNSTLSAGAGLKRVGTLLRRSAFGRSVPWRTVGAETRSTLRRTTRIKADPALVRAAKAFHDAVWERYGERCVLCDRPHPAVHAAHVLKRSMLGKLRYADPRFARPAHWDCHREQEENRRPFPLAVRLDAVRAYNALTKNALLQEPTR